MRSDRRADPPQGKDEGPFDEIRRLRHHVRVLEEDADRTRLILETANDPFITMDAEGRVVTWNARAERTFGWPRAEILGKTLIETIVPHAHRAAHEGGLRRYLATGEGPMLERRVEVTALCRDGREIPVELTVWPFQADGTVTFHAFVRDLTEARQAAEVLRRSEEYFRTLVEKGADTVGLLDARGAVLYASPSITRILGYAPTEILGRCGFDLVHPDDLAGARAAFAAVLADPARETRAEFRVRHRDGSWRFIEANGSNHLGDPSVCGVLGHLRDVTERRAAEEALRRAEEKYRSIFENAPEGIFRATREWHLVAANSALAQMLGDDAPEQFTARVNAEGGLFPPSVEHRADIDRALATHGHATRLSCELVRRDGTRIQTLLHARPVSDAAGRVLFIEGAVVDVTDRTRLESQLRHAQKMEAVGRLAGGVAHDFNNLLTVISGYTAMALEHFPSEAHWRGQLLEVQRASARAAELTQQLLVFSRKQALQPRVIDISALVSGAAQTLGRLIGAGIELTFDLANDLERVKADPGQFEQVLMNLAVNARDAMPSGGRLSFETRNVERVPVTRDARVGARTHRYVRLSVRDTGHGMDEATRTRIFEPFFTTKDAGKGSGLGLAVVDGVVRQSGGHIEVQSEVGRGTAFHVYLPAVGEALDIFGAAPTDRANAKGGETVLLVDDNEDVRALVAHVLRSVGYSVLEARDGVDALHVCDAHPTPVHLLLTDIITPRMSGPQLAEELVARFPDLRVLYVSGYGEDVLRQWFPSVRAAFLQKPFTPDVLAHEVRAILDV